MNTKHMLNDISVLRMVQLALAEDVGTGDVTSEGLIGETELGHGVFLAKSSGVVAGTVVAALAFDEVDRSIGCDWVVKEGDAVEAGTIIGHVRGPARGILTAERTALNFLQRMSGIATMTREFVKAVEGTGTRILDTRKTIPGWRMLDKYSVAIGGGVNHRMGLYDMVMIKDNHIAAHGSICGAVAAVRRYLQDHGLERIPIEVETRNLTEVSEALSCGGVKRIMFDNFPLELMREAVVLVSDRVETEASGNVTLDTVRPIAETGVTYISSGALTHSVRAMDISLDYHRV